MTWYSLGGKRFETWRTVADYAQIVLHRSLLGVALEGEDAAFVRIKGSRWKSLPKSATEMDVQARSPHRLHMRVRSVPLPLLPTSERNHAVLSHATLGLMIAERISHKRVTISGLSFKSAIHDSMSQSVPSASLWMTGLTGFSL